MSRLPAGGDTLDRLPLQKIAAKTSWVRISAIKFTDPIYWSKAPGGRFNPVSESFGVCYMAENLTGAVAESICRNAAILKESEKFTTLSTLEERRCFEVTILPELKVLDFTIANWASFRMDALVTTEYEIAEDEGQQKTLYRWGPAWSDHAKRLGLDGVLYPSRHHTICACLALFERPDEDLSYSSLYNCNAEHVLEVLEQEFDWAVME